MQAPVTPAKKTPTKLFKLLSTAQLPQAKGDTTMTEGVAPPAATIEATNMGNASTSVAPALSEPSSGRASKRAAKNK